MRVPEIETMTEKRRLQLIRLDTQYNFTQV